MEGRGGYFCFEKISDWPMSMISNTSLCYVCILWIEKVALFVKFIIKTSYLLWKVTSGFPNMNIILFLGAWRLSHNLDRCHNSLILQYYNTIVLERSCLEKQDCNQVSESPPSVIHSTLWYDKKILSFHCMELYYLLCSGIFRIIWLRKHRGRYHYEAC